MAQCLSELSTLREALRNERAALQQERRRRQACETELQMLHREVKGSAMCSAAAADDVETLRELAKTSDVNKGDYDQRTPMHIAAADGRIEAVTCLVALNAKLSPADRWGNTPLDDAMAAGHTAMVTYLESKGATLSSGFLSRSAAAFRTAAASGDVPKLIKLARHVNANTANYEQRTALHLAASGGSLEAVECLLDLGADVSPVDRWGNTPLDAAMRQNHTAVVSHLKDTGAVQGNADGLGFAARNASTFRNLSAAGDVEAMRQLAPQTDVNAGNYEKRTPLHLAAAGGNLEAVRCLLDLGAGASPLDGAGLTPLDEALRQGFVEMAACLEARGAYRGASFRQMKRPSSVDIGRRSRKPSTELAVPLSIGEQAAAFATFTERGLLALGSELDLELSGATATPTLRCAGCLGPAIVANYSCHGAEPDSHGMAVGKRNQDCACAVNPVAGQDAAALFCVFDGHGRHGHVVSREALASMHFELERSTELARDPAAALTAAFESVQAHLRLLATVPSPDVPARESGACALVAYLHSERLTVAGAGDCRAVLGTERDGTLCAVDLSTDHKVDDPAEHARITGTGAYVSTARGASSDDNYVPARMYENAAERWRGPGLTMSRALGDTDAEACGLIPTPTVSARAIGSDDHFVILASDGIWEFIDSSEAVDIVHKAFRAAKPASEAAQELIMRAVLRWAQVEGSYRDDISAQVIYLAPTVAALHAQHADLSDAPAA